MTADIFTKALAKDDFVRHRDRLTNASNAVKPPKAEKEITVSDDSGSSIKLLGKAARLWSKLIMSSSTKPD